MRVIGHRGARFEAPENTLSGFRYALDLGLDGFEFDIHLTHDNELVVIHDATLDLRADAMEYDAKQRILKLTGRVHARYISGKG